LVKPGYEFIPGYELIPGYEFIPGYETNTFDKWSGFPL
jgi:hypothetical protein